MSHFHLSINFFFVCIRGSPFRHFIRGFDEMFEQNFFISHKFENIRMKRFGFFCLHFITFREPKKNAVKLTQTTSFFSLALSPEGTKKKNLKKGKCTLNSRDRYINRNSFECVS